MLEYSLKKFRYLNYLLAVLIVFASLLLVRNVVSISFSKNGEPQVASEDTPLPYKNKKDIMHYSGILERNPFGEPMSLKPIAGEKKEATFHGSLTDLTLVGTVVGPRWLSYAIFENKANSSTGGQEVFAYREKIYDYGMLTTISSSSVEIEQDGRLYKLTIPFEEAGEKLTGEPDRRSSTPQNSFARKVGEREYVLDGRRVQKSLESPEQILTDARLLPNFVDGKQEGFKVSEVIPDGIYHTMGIRNGDILLRVNGLEISNPEVAMQAMTALKGMNRVELDIAREGKNMSMNYQIR